MGTVATLKRETHGQELHKALEELRVRGYIVSAMNVGGKRGNSAYTIEYYQRQTFEEQAKLFPSD